MIDSLSLLSIAVFAALLFISVAFHETMHALIAYKLGDNLAHSRGRVSLNPLRHIDPMLTIALPVAMLLLGLPPILAAKPVPVNSSRLSGEEIGMAAVAVAGPLTNLFLATCVAILLRLSGVDGVIYDVLLLAVRLNVGLFVFNMMPLPPLDGSRVLYAVAPEPVRRVMDQVEQFGFPMMLLLLFFFLQFLSPILVSGNDFVLSILLPS